MLLPCVSISSIVLLIPYALPTQNQFPTLANSAQGLPVQQEACHGGVPAAGGPVSGHEGQAGGSKGSPEGEAGSAGQQRAAVCSGVQVSQRHERMLSLAACSCAPPFIASVVVWENLQPGLEAESVHIREIF